jgi:uncharacterized protein YqgC (DUF456 family)
LAVILRCLSAEQIIGLILALLVMVCASIGSILPGIPGTPVVLLAAIGHRLYFGPAGANNWVLAGLVLLTLLSVVFDYLASMFGAKKLGATWLGVTGAVVGSLVGIFFNIPGILLGPFIGALLFEFAGGREFKLAAKAGIGATLGLLAGAVGKLAICIAMMGLFAVNVVYRSLNV